MITAAMIIKNEDFVMTETMTAIRGIANKYGKSIDSVFDALKVEGSEIQESVRAHVAKTAQELADSLNAAF